MANTVRENIMDQLQTMLAAITVNNGYANNVATVQRWKQNGNEIATTPTIILVPDEETKDPQPNPFYTNHLPIAVDVWLSQAESDTTPSDSLINSILGDIENCIGADPTLGGLALDAIFKSNKTFQGIPGQPNFGIVIILQVTYQTRITDPTQGS